MRQSTQTAIGVLSVIALAVAFWLLLLGPKREKADELATQTNVLSAEVASEQQKASEAIAAKEQFPDLYRQLVVLGKAVPGEAATPSLLVQLNGIGAEADASFKVISLGGVSEGEAGAEAESMSLLPIGASVGTAGLPAMPYQLDFQGGFFSIADFIEGLDAQVQTTKGEVDANGRLVTIDSFSLIPKIDEGSGGPIDQLKAQFQVTTYVAPTDQGLTAGASATGPEAATTSE